MSSARALSLYRGLLRHGSRFQQSNFRDYALRCTRETFRQHRKEADPARVEELLCKAEHELGVVQRQAVISRLYPLEPTVADTRK